MSTRVWSEPRFINWGANICRSAPAAERSALWESEHGPVPSAMRVGWTCAVSYCSKLEHMQLAKNLNARNANYIQYRAKIEALEIDDYFEIPDVPANEKDLIKFRSGLLNAAGLWKIVMRSYATGGVRIYKVGQWGSLWSDTKHIRSKKGIPLLNTKNRLIRPALLFLGFMQHRPSDEGFKRTEKCSTKACIHPALQGAVECHLHRHFFDWKESMTWNGLDLDRVWTPSQPHSTAFDLAPEYPVKIERLEQSLTFTLSAKHHRGIIHDDRHKNAGAEEIVEATTQKRKPYINPSRGREIEVEIGGEFIPPVERASDGMVYVRVIPEDKLLYAPDTKSPFSLHASPSMRHMGHGHGRGSSKTTLGRQKRGISRRVTRDTRKRWSREELELEANRLLGEEAIDIEQEARGYVPLINHEQP